jgi:hypothetical protein
VIGVHEESLSLSKYLEDGYIEVQRDSYFSEKDQKKFHRLWLANPEDTCLRKMRGWKAGNEVQHGFCTMDKGHRGKCSTVTFYCDGCGKTRRGRPHRVYDEEEVQFCFMCMEVDNGRYY